MQSQKEWLKTQDIEAWETMFFCVRQYCEISAFHITNGTFSRSDVKDYALKVQKAERVLHQIFADSVPKRVCQSDLQSAREIRAFYDKYR